MAKSSSATLMTEGSIWKHLLFFAIPIFWGNLFQQLYNAADSLIVGNFLGSAALAAVSSSGNLIFLMVGFFNGLAMGAGVVISRYFGAGDMKNMRKAIHTTVAVGFFCGIILTVIGVVAAPQILVLIGTPAEVLPNSITYFRIYFMGSVAFVMYNCCVGVLQSVGDSKHPLIYLIISSVVNIVLDLLFIGVFHMGVGAAAAATIISQFISAILCIWHLIKGPEETKLHLKELRIHKDLLSQILKNGIPAGVNNSIISIANVFVQSNINSFGALAVAGCGAYAKIQGFAFLPVTCFTMALATFISQNLGAKKVDRVKKGVAYGVFACMIAAELIGICSNILAPHLIALFDRTPEVIAYGVQYAKTDTLFYFLLAFSHCMAAIFRGAGKATVPMYVMMIFWCFVRVGYISIILKFIPEIGMIFWAYPLTWALSSIVFLIYYFKGNWMGVAAE